MGFSINPSADQQPYPDFTGAVSQGTQVGQQMAAASALRGIDINDPASVNKGMGALVRAGATDQASALANLGFLRFQQQAAIQGYGDAASLFSGQSSAGGPQSPPAAPDQSAMSAEQMADAQQVAQFGKTSADQLLSIKDPQLRQDQADAISAQAQKMGVPDSFVQSALGDLSDEHLAGLSANYGKWLQHPVLGGSGTGPMPDLHPTSQAYTQAPNPFSNPNVLRFLIQQGVLRNPQLPAIVDALKPAQGYTGVVSPGATASFGGQPTMQAPNQPMDVAPGGKVFQPDTGQQVAANPALQQNVTVAPGSNVFGFNQQTGQFSDPNNPNGPPAGGGAQAGASGGAAPNNNPAGVKTPATGKWPGQTGTTPGGLAIFDNPSDGYAAADKNLLSYATTHGVNTIAGIVNRWTPPGVDGNPDQGPRIAAISKALGVSPTVPLDLQGNPVLRHALLSQIIQGETGGGPTTTQQAAGGQPEFGGKVMAPPVAGPHGGLFQTDFTGQVHGTGQALDPGALNSVRQTTISNEQVKGAQTALANWQAMTTNASQMTGPAAMGMVDSMVSAYSGLGARQMNVNALMATFGIPAQLQGAFQKAFEGKGPLTVPDASGIARRRLFVRAVALRPRRSDRSGPTQFCAAAGRRSQGVGWRASANATAFLCLPPPPSTHVNGAVIETPGGKFQWNGQRWAQFNG